MQMAAAQRSADPGISLAGTQTDLEPVGFAQMRRFFSVFLHVFYSNPLSNRRRPRINITFTFEGEMPSRCEISATVMSCP